MSGHMIMTSGSCDFFGREVINPKDEMELSSKETLPVHTNPQENIKSVDGFLSHYS